jgi:hypothetical protein
MFSKLSNNSEISQRSNPYSQRRNSEQADRPQQHHPYYQSTYQPHEDPPFRPIGGAMSVHSFTTTVNQS